MNSLKHIRWDESSGTAHNARIQLPAVVAAYYARVRETIGGKTKDSEFHALRVLTKRVRYALELFRACYGPGLRVRLAALRHLQQLLGEVSDCAAAAKVLAKCETKNSVQRRRLEQFLMERRIEKVDHFRQFWTREFDAPGKEQWWTGYLARHARQTGRKR